MGGRTANLYSMAANLCAAEIYESGAPAEHPRDADGLEFVRKAVSQGCPREQLVGITDPRLRRVVDWASQLKPAEVAMQKSSENDEDIRILDPIID
jgi:hypothetical protein